MLQTAMIAEKKNSSKSLVCACLLHDIGHFIIRDPDQLVLESVDGKHEEIGFNFLKNYFKEDIIEPIKLHVHAKRYLCRQDSYYNLLSDASKTSLKIQGGKMKNEEVNKFLKLKYFQEAIMLRKCDDEGKNPNIKTKNINDYKKLIKEYLIN